jgi:hypothetical protein
MFDKNVDDRLSLWAEQRRLIETSETPFDDVWEFWKKTPFIPYNNQIDPYHQNSWPSPWEIIVENRYDDFTKAIMIAWTLKLTKRFANSSVQIRTLVDKSKSALYNIVYIDEIMAINYSDNGPVFVKDIPDSFFLENFVELNGPR